MFPHSLSALSRVSISSHWTKNCLSRVQPSFVTSVKNRKKRYVNHRETWEQTSHPCGWRSGPQTICRDRTSLWKPQGQTAGTFHEIPGAFKTPISSNFFSPKDTILEAFLGFRDARAAGATIKPVKKKKIHKTNLPCFFLKIFVVFCLFFFQNVCIRLFLFLFSRTKTDCLLNLPYLHWISTVLHWFLLFCSVSPTNRSLFSRREEGSSVWLQKNRSVSPSLTRLHAPPRNIFLCVGQSFINFLSIRVRFYFVISIFGLKSEWFELLLVFRAVLKVKTTPMCAFTPAAGRRTS